jgi:alpha-L-fucosidase 2
MGPLPPPHEPKPLLHARSSCLSVMMGMACLGWSVSGLSATVPPAELNLVLKAPINTWDEAVPLGNGLMGGLLWGDKNLIRLSFDRGDLWDERAHGEKEWWKIRTYAKGAELVAKKDFGTVNGWWDGPYNGTTPTKLPAGRLEITLAPGQEAEKFELNLASAEGIAHLAGGGRMTAFFSAATPIAVVRIPGPEPKAIDLVPSGARKRGGNAGPSSGGVVSALGYPVAQYGTEGTAKWYVQEAADGLKYCVCVESRRIDNESLLAIAVTSTNDAPDLLGLARQRCSTAIKQGYAKMLEPHAAWWQEFWAQSSVTIPAEDIEISRQYYLVQYFHGAASRRGAPPMPLQGVWTADNGGLPPWKGDYHNDLNTQMTYIAYQGAGHFEEGLSFLDYLWDRRPTFLRFAREFYGTSGLATPGVMSLAGQPLGGWGQYSLSPTMTAWCAHLFYLHWRYTGDDTFLRSRAYPWCADAGDCMLGLLKPDANGIQKLPLSSSPEVFDNSGRAWLVPNSNYDIMCLKMLFLTLQEMAASGGRSDEAKKWEKAVSALGDFHADATGMLLVDAKTTLPYSHRHLSNIIGLYPFNLITREGGQTDAKRIDASLAQWDKLGTNGWCGYSFSWMSCLRARVGDAESALRHLDIYCNAFILRNGFHANGDQTRSGYSGFTYRPFTLEGNFLAAQAVQEMLLQSWSPTPGQLDTEIIRIFPSTPWRWHSAAFTDLRAEGGHRVSAKRENNATTWFRVTAGKDGTVRIRDNFSGRQPKWDRDSVKKVGDNYEIALKKGQSVEAELAKPATIPPAPANLAEPVVTRRTGHIQPTKLPLRIGADSNGGSNFQGGISRALVADRPLSADEIAKLANRTNADWARTSGALVALVLTDKGVGNLANAKLVPKAIGQIQPSEMSVGLAQYSLRFNGRNYVEIQSDAVLNCTKGITLAAWVFPDVPAASMRIIDKSPVGAASGYLLDTHPDNALRLITREPHFSYPAKLPAKQWTHVAATVDGNTGRQTLYINGKRVAEKEE